MLTCEEQKMKHRRKDSWTDITSLYRDKHTCVGNILCHMMDLKHPEVQGWSVGDMRSLLLNWNTPVNHSVLYDNPVKIYENSAFRGLGFVILSEHFGKHTLAEACGCLYLKVKYCDTSEFSLTSWSIKFPEQNSQDW